jgi:hypothetical protein
MFNHDQEPSDSKPTSLARLIGFIPEQILKLRYVPFLWALVKIRYLRAVLSLYRLVRTGVALSLKEFIIPCTT